MLTVRTRLALIAVVAIGALLSLVAVNASRAWEQQTNLRNDSATGRLGGEASLPLFSGAQTERKLTAAYMTKPTPEAKKALDKQRRKTDKGIASFRHLSGSKLKVEQRHKYAYVKRVYKQLDKLDGIRDQADKQAGKVDDVVGYYSGIISRLIEFYQELSAMDDGDLALETRPLVGLFWASDALAMEDTLIAEARAAGHMSARHRTAFAEAYGTQRVMYQRWIAPYLPAKDKATYDKITDSGAWRQKKRVEYAIVNARTLEPKDSASQSAADGNSTDGDSSSAHTSKVASSGSALPNATRTWDDTYQQLAQQIGALNLSRTQGLLQHGFQRADQIRTQALWQMGGSVAAILVIALLIIGIIRSITSRLRTLQDSTERSARKLPEVVQQLQDGQSIDIDTEFPQPRPRRDEFAHLEVAFTAAQRTAAEQAVAQVGDRQGFAGFVSATSARSVNLVERSLDLLEELQKKHGEDIPLLRDLIHVDRASVAVRRHLDNMQTLASRGYAEPYTDPKALVDLVNDAAVETDDPERVSNQITAHTWVKPGVVNGVIHVVAALLDNALGFSPSTVTVTSASPVHGTAVEVEDMGTGMSDEEYADANAKLATPPTFLDMAHNQDGRLGLFVVGQLSRRYGLSVQLRRSVYRGTVAVVMLPQDVQCEPDDATHPQPRTPDSSPPQGEATPQGGEAPRGGGTSQEYAAPQAQPGPRLVPDPQPTAHVPPDVRAPLPQRASRERGDQPEQGGSPEQPARQEGAPHAAAQPTVPAQARGLIQLPARTRRPGQAADSSTGWTPETPAQESAPPRPPAASEQTDPAAPPLPRRAPQTHLAPELAEPAAAPTPYRPENDATPEQVAASWGAYQRGTRAAEQHPDHGPHAPHGPYAPYAPYDEEDENR